jgi:hypothetical protein
MVCMGAARAGGIAAPFIVLLGTSLHAAGLPFLVFGATAVIAGWVPQRVRGQTCCQLMLPAAPALPLLCGPLQTAGVHAA